MSSVTTDEQADSGLVDRLSYLVALSRPRFWFYLAGPVVVGVAVAATSVDELFGSTAVALFAYFLLPANVLLYGVNDIFDAEVDTENPKKDDKEVRWQGDRSVTAAVVLSGLLGVGLLGVTPPAAWPWLVGFLFLAVEYSAPPLRFKTTPLLDSVSNGLYILPGIAAYVVVAGGQPPALAVVGAWLWTMGDAHVFGDPRHRTGSTGRYPDDRYCSRRTTDLRLRRGLLAGRVAGIRAGRPSTRWPARGVPRVRCLGHPVVGGRRPSLRGGFRRSTPPLAP